MKEYWRKKLWITGAFLVAVVACEIVTFLMMGIGVLPRYFLINFGIALVPIALIFIIPSIKANTILYAIFFVIQGSISCANVFIYRHLAEILTLDMFALGTEAAGALSLGIFDVWIPLVFLILLIALIGAFTVINLRLKSAPFPDEYRRQNAFVLAAFFLAMGIIAPFAGVIQKWALPNNSNNTVLGFTKRQNFDNLTFKTAFFRDFGTFTIIYRNFLTNTPPSRFVPQFTAAEANAFFRGTDALPQNAAFPTTANTTAFTGNDGIKNIDNNQNGMNNVIVVLLESFDKIFVNEKYTPNIYRLMQNEINFTKFYANNKTDYSEASAIFGSYPSFGTLPVNVPKLNVEAGKEHNLFPFSVPNMMRTRHNALELQRLPDENDADERMPFTANYFLMHWENHYNRPVTHPLYGFDDVFFNETYIDRASTCPRQILFNNYAGTWIMPEAVYIERALEDFMPTDKRFCSYISFINPHMPYNRAPTDLYGARTLAWLTENEGDDFKNMHPGTYALYRNALAMAMVADDGIGYMMHELNRRICEFTGKRLSENTTIVFHTDHAAYGHSMHVLANNDVTSRYQPEAHRLNSFIYSPGTQGNEFIVASHSDAFHPSTHTNNALPVQYVIQYTSPKAGIKNNQMIGTFDLVPAIFDLLGINYNPRLYLGTNPFDETRAPSILISPGMIFNDKISTNGIYLHYVCESATDADKAAFRKSFQDRIRKMGHIDHLFRNGSHVFFN
jgi:arylsulfatase A-like enzyme